MNGRVAFAGSGPGRASLVLAVVTVNLAVFAASVWAGYPGVFAAFALATAAGLGYASGRGTFTTVTATLGAVLLVGLGLPVLLFVVRQSPEAVGAAALEPAVHRTLYLSVYGPFLAAVISVAFGVPLALLLARGFAGQPIVESLIDLPLVVPHSVAGLIVLYGFGRRGLLPGVTVRNTLLGMVIALVFVSAPYAVNAAREAFEGIDRRLEYAARVHGANEWETARRVTIPLASRGILTGGVLAWARSVSEFGAVIVVAYSVRFFYPPAGDLVAAQHAPVFVYTEFLAAGLESSGAVAILLLAVAAVIFLGFRWLTADRAAFP